MHLKSIVLIALGATCVVADEHTLNQIIAIKEATSNLYKKLAAWDGGYLGAASVVMHSRSLISTINAAASPRAKYMAERAVCSAETEREEIDLARSLAVDVGDTVDMAIATRPMMEAIPYAGTRVGGIIFRRLHEASAALGAELAPKAKEENQEEVAAILKDIEGHFQRGSEVYG